MPLRNIPNTTARNSVPERSEQRRRPASCPPQKVICNVGTYQDRRKRASTQIAAGVLAKRLREKDVEWRLARKGLARRWRTKSYARRRSDRSGCVRGDYRATHIARALQRGGGRRTARLTEQLWLGPNLAVERLTLAFLLYAMSTQPTFGL
mgnify:CR=1 FL=1